MAVSQYGIDVYNFEFWRGPAPSRVQEHGRVFTRPGANGIALQRNGIYGDTFEVTLESWWETFAEADAAVDAYKALPFAGRLWLQYAGLNYTGLYGLMYHALSVEHVRTKQVPMLRRAGVGGLLYSPGTILLTRWSLIPEYVG